MSTSGTTVWDLTVSEICRAAAQELGVIGAGADLDDDEEEDCILRLNMMLKSWQTRVNLFRETTGELVIVGGVGSGTLTEDVRDVSAVRFVNTDDTERPLQPWNRAQYYVLPDRSAVGNPTAYYLSQGIGTDTIHIWPVPADDITLKVDYSRMAETVTDGTETLDIPQEWHECVIKGLAKRIANIFGVTRTDPQVVQKIAAEADELERLLLDSDRPDTYVFEPWYA